MGYSGFRRFSFYRGIFGGLLTRILSITITTLSLFLGLRDGVFPPQYRDRFLWKYIPYLPWYWWVLGGLALLILLILERAYRIYDEERSKLITSYEAKIQDLRSTQIDTSRLNRPVEGTSIDLASSRVKRESSKPLPNIIFHESASTDVMVDHQGGIRLVTEDPHWDPNYLGESSLQAVLGEFVNEVVIDRKTALVRSVKARLSYMSSGGHKIRVSKGCWLNDNEGFVAFEPGESNQLIVAVRDIDGKVFAIENQYQEPDHFALPSSRIRAKYEALKPPKLHLLADKQYRVNLVLHGNDLDPPKSFDFELTVEPDFILRLL